MALMSCKPPYTVRHGVRRRNELASATSRQFEIDQAVAADLERIIRAARPTRRNQPARAS